METSKNPAASELARLKWSRISPEERSKLLRANRLKGLQNKLKKKKS